MSTPESERRPISQRTGTRKTVAALVIAGLLVAFGVANNDDVSVNWIITTTQTPLIIVIALSAVLGAILGFALGRRSRRGGRGGG